MNIKNLNKAEVLAALYNGSRQQGIGFLNHEGGNPLSVKEAEKLLGKTKYFDYLRGRVMKIDLNGDDLHTHLYNRDNGEDAAEKILATLIEIPLYRSNR